MLLDKLREKFSKKSALTDETEELLNKVKISNKNKISKKIATFVLASAMVLAPLGIAACKTTGNTTTPTNQTQTNNGGTNNNGNSNNNGNNNQGGNKDDGSQEFSSILNKILDDDYYISLREKAFEQNLEITNDMKPIPYKFLRNNSHNVDAYLDGTLDAFASSYIYDNDHNHIYVSVKAENTSSSKYGNFYTDYVLKYSLTNQEYEEYTYLCDGEYLQGLLFIQELDNQKKPEMLSKVNIAKDTYKKMLELYPKTLLNPERYNSLEIDILELNENKITMSIRNGSKSNYIQSKIGILDFRQTEYTELRKYDGNVYYLVDPVELFALDIDNYPSSLQNITSFGYGTQIDNLNPYHHYDLKSKNP